MVYARTEIVVLADGSLQPPPTSGPLPPAREFLTSAGFGGALALLAAIVLALVVVVVVWRASKRHRAELEQRERHYEQERATKERAAEIAVAEQRFRWIVETAGLEPSAGENATLRLGPELALELLSGLLSDAKRLGDDTLAKAITVYLNQFSLVLTQQGGPLAHLRNGSGHIASPPRAADPESAKPSDQQSAGVASDGDSADAPPATGRRRRR